MYLHLGSDYMIKSSEVIVILNTQTADFDIYNSHIYTNRDKYEIIDASEGEEVYSCVLTKDKVYLSGISSITLKKRLEEVLIADAFYINV